MTLTFNFKRPPALPDGTHEAKIAKIAEVQRKAFQSEELETQIEFTFRVAVDGDPEPIDYKRHYRPSISDRSALVRDLKILRGAKPVDSAKASDEAMSELITSCLNMRCLIVTQTNDKGYSNISAVMPAPKASSAFDKPKPKPVAPLALEPESMSKARDEDDIDF